MAEFRVASGRKIHAIDITGRVAQCLPADAHGIVYIFTPHTTVALMIGENEANLMADLERTAAHLLDYCGPFQHAGGGNANAPAHLLSSLAGVSVCVPVQRGRMRLGTYQRILLVELDGPRERQVFVTLIPSQG